MKFITLLFIFYLSFCPAQWQRTIHGNGDIDSLSHSVKNFTSLELIGPFDVVLTDNPKSVVTIKGESNLIPYVEASVFKSKLTLRSKAQAKLIHSQDLPLKVFVSRSKIDNIYLIGSGSIRSNDPIPTAKLNVEMIGSGYIKFPVVTKRFTCQLTGSGTADFLGSSDVLKARVIGSGQLHAKELITDDAYFVITGSGQANVNCKGKLKARIDGPGQLVYIGNPQDVSISSWNGREKHTFSGSNIAVKFSK